jgi:Rrf2 family protein
MISARPIRNEHPGWCTNIIWPVRVRQPPSGQIARGYLQSRGLGQRLRIPGPYLAKVLYTLSKHDVLESVAGRTGGYRLKRPAGSLSLKTLIGIFEPESLSPVCVVGNADCPGASCRRHRKWQEMRNRFLASMEETTIAGFGGMEDLDCGRPEEMAALAQIDGKTLRVTLSWEEPRGERKPTREALARSSLLAFGRLAEAGQTA